MEDSFGWTEAMIHEHTPRPIRDHSPWFDCPCLTCMKTRRDVERYGFNEAGGIAYPKPKAAFPWEEAA